MNKHLKNKLLNLLFPTMLLVCSANLLAPEKSYDYYCDFKVPQAAEIAQTVRIEQDTKGLEDRLTTTGQAYKIKVSSDLPEGLGVLLDDESFQCFIDNLLELAAEKKDLITLYFKGCGYTYRLTKNLAQRNFCIEEVSHVPSGHQFYDYGKYVTANSEAQAQNVLRKVCLALKDQRPPFVLAMEDYLSSEIDPLLVELRMVAKYFHKKTSFFIRSLNFDHEICIDPDEGISVEYLHRAVSMGMRGIIWRGAKDLIVELKALKRLEERKEREAQKLQERQAAARTRTVGAQSHKRTRSSSLTRQSARAIGVEV